MSNLISTPSALTFLSDVGGSPSDQSLAVTWSGGASPSIPYAVSDDAAWLSTLLASGSTPDTQTAHIDTTGLVAGIYTGNILLDVTDYFVAGQGSIPFPMAAPGGAWTNAANTVSSNLAFSLTDSALYHALSFSNGGGGNILTYLVKLDRATNAVVWNVLTHTGNAGTTTFWNADLVCVSPDGTHVYMVMFHKDTAVGRVTVEQRLTSDGSLVASVDAIGAGFNGKPYDVDIATIAGVEYLAIGSYDVTGNVIHHLSIVRTSDMTVTLDHTNNSGTATQTPTAVAFDASGNVWWAPLISGAGFNNRVIKTTVPGGTATTTSLAASIPADSIAQLAYDPVDGTLLGFSTTKAYRISITGTPAVTQTTTTSHSSNNLNGSVFNPSGRLNGGAVRMWQRGTLVNEPLTRSFTGAKIITANSKAFYPANLDDQTNNPHLSASVDMTLWTNAFTTASSIDQYAWFDLTLPNSLSVPITLNIAAACTLVVVPPTLDFAAQVGTNPSAQNVDVSNSAGPDAVPFTISASDPWIVVPPTGSTPQSIPIAIDTTGLVAGDYAGTVTFSSVCNNVTIDLTLSVTTEPPPPPPPPGPVDIPCGRALTRTDTWELDTGQADWASDNDTPLTWWETTLPQQRLGIAKAPIDVGNIGVWYIALAATLIASPVNLAIPDDWTPYILWGALADLFSHDGPAFDPARAQYCERRYSEGVELARLVLGGPPS